MLFEWIRNLWKRFLMLFEWIDGPPTPWRPETEIYPIHCERECTLSLPGFDGEKTTRLRSS